MNHYDSALMERVLTGPAVPEIVEMEARLREAQLNADVAALDNLISEDLLFSGPNGQLISKAQDLESHRSGVVRFRVHRPEELHIRRLGDGAAVTSLRVYLELEFGGDLVSGPFRYTRVWACEDEGLWKVVGGHVSLVTPQE